MTLQAIRLALKKDDTYQRLERLYEQASSFNLDEIEEEAARLHSARPSRSLMSKGVTPSSLNKAICVDMSNRSRLLELRSNCMRSITILATAIRGARVHLRASYGDSLKAVFGTTRADIEAGIDKLILRYSSLHSSLENTIEILDSYIKDIDQSGYALRNLVDIAKLTLGGAGARSEVM